MKIKISILYISSLLLGFVIGKVQQAEVANIWKLSSSVDSMKVYEATASFVTMKNVCVAQVLRPAIDYVGNEIKGRIGVICQEPK